jgi:hypothetical protein
VQFQQPEPGDLLYIPRCSNNHKLRRVLSRNLSSKCFYCCNAINRNSYFSFFQAFSCLECEFDMCMECYYHLHHKMDPSLLCEDTPINSSSSSSSSSSGGGGGESSSYAATTSTSDGNDRNIIENFRSVQCYKFHNCVISSNYPFPYRNGWNCNLCSRNGVSERWFCRTCSFDICFTCITKDKVINPNNDIPISGPINIATINPLYYSPLPKSLSDDSSHLETWRIKSLVKSGSVNWKDASNNILFHFNPRQATNSIVMNSFLNNAWGAEEAICLPNLQSDEYLDIKVIVSTIGFEVYFKDELLHIYCHRAPWQTFKSVISLVQYFSLQTQFDSSWEIIKL